MAETNKEATDEKTTADPEVVKKYKAAGDIVNKIIQSLIHDCVPGASVKALCEKGDKLIFQESEKKYKNTKDIKKRNCIPNMFVHKQLHLPLFTIKK